MDPQNPQLIPNQVNSPVNLSAILKTYSPTQSSTQPNSNQSINDTLSYLKGLLNPQATQSPQTTQTSQTPQASPGINPAIPQNLNDIQNMVKEKTTSAFGANEWPAMYQLVMNESGFNPNAQNPNSEAYGLGQFLNSTWEGTGIKKTSDPSLQADAMIQYIKNRYSTPSSALDFWLHKAPTQAVGGGSHWY